MKCKVGKPMYIFDEYTELNRRLHLVIKELLYYCDKILLIDTLYAYAPQYSYRSKKHFDLFKRVLHKKIVSPYDLWDLFNNLEQYIKDNKIEVVCINALNLIFTQTDAEDATEMSRGIKKQLEYLTEKYKLITIVGNAPTQNESANRAFSELESKI